MPVGCAATAADDGTVIGVIVCVVREAVWVKEVAWAASVVFAVVFDIVALTCVAVDDAARS